MLKEAMQYLVGLAPTETFEYYGLQYTSSTIQPVVPPQPNPLMLNTLESIAGLKGDCFNVDAAKVILLGAEDPWKRRAIIAEATAIVPSFQCNGYQPHEHFILWVLTHFEDDAERARLLSFAGNIRTESVHTSEDDGVTQVAAVKRGAKLREEGWKNPVTLAPFRTFDEVAQPKSRFIFRIREDIQMGLFSVEDQAWKLDAMRAIRDHLVQLGVKAPIYL